LGNVRGNVGMVGIPFYFHLTLLLSQAFSCVKLITLQHLGKTFIHFAMIVCLIV